jgi:hypothetical protein
VSGGAHPTDLKIGGSPHRFGNVYIAVCNDMYTIGEEKVRTGIYLLVYKRTIVKCDRPVARVPAVLVAVV